MTCADDLLRPTTSSLLVARFEAWLLPNILAALARLKVMGRCTEAIIRVGAWGGVSGVLLSVARHANGTIAILANGLAGIALLIAGLEIMTPEAPPETCTIETTTTADRAQWELRVEATTASMAGVFLICQPYLHSFQAWTRFADGQQNELRLSSNDTFVTLTNVRDETVCITIGHDIASTCVCVPWVVFAKSLRKAINSAADRGLQFAE
jgi:hypothetical protein